MINHNSRIRIPVTVPEETIPEQSEAKDEPNEAQETDCTALEEELEAAQQEANDYKDKYLRAQAEMANFKKRLERRYEEQVVEEEKKHLLAQEGVEEMAPEGQPFDPLYHEAVAIIPTSEAGADTVVAEIQKGYLYRGQLLRPARVHVAGASSNDNSTNLQDVV